MTFFSSGNIGPSCPDGRGDKRLFSQKGIEEAIDEAARDAPPHHFLLGVIPLKLMRVDYIVENRNDEFLVSVKDEVIGACETGRRIRNSENPQEEFQKFLAQSRSEAPKKEEEVFWSDDETDEDIPIRE